MSSQDFIIALFYRVDLVLGHLPKPPQARLYPSEIVTLALLFALKGGSGRAFYRWLWRDYAAWFPGLPETHPFVSPVCRPSGVGRVLFGRPHHLGRD